MGGTNISSFFFPLSAVRKGKRLLLAIELHWHPGLGNNPLMMPEDTTGKRAPRVLVEMSVVASFH